MSSRIITVLMSFKTIFSSVLGTDFLHFHNEIILVLLLLLLDPSNIKSCTQSLFYNICC